MLLKNIGVRWSRIEVRMKNVELDDTKIYPAASHVYNSINSYYNYFTVLYPAGHLNEENTFIRWRILLI